MRFHWQYFFLGGLGGALFFFTLAALSDYFYSDCLAIGTGFMTCTNGAAVLSPLVVNGHYWYLTPFMMPYGDTISQTMGRVAGISFLFIFGSFFLWQANRNGKGNLSKQLGKLCRSHCIQRDCLLLLYDRNSSLSALLPPRVLPNK